MELASYMTQVMDHGLFEYYAFMSSTRDWFPMVMEEAAKDLNHTMERLKFSNLKEMMTAISIR